MRNGGNLSMPYPGLRPFEEADGPLFFGREKEIAAMLAALHKRQFIAVVGSSGSGKSSLVKAGLLPAIAEGFLCGTDDWVCLVVKPGHDPYERLAKALVKARHGDEVPASRKSEHYEDTLNVLRETDRGLLNALEKLYPKKSVGEESKRIFLVIDQFEELFAFRSSRSKNEEYASKDEAAAFVSLLLHACDEIKTRHEPNKNVRVVLTMRSDFIGHCEAFLALPESVSRSQFLVPRMDSEQLEQVIRRPGEVQTDRFREFKVHNDLVSRIVDKTGARPDHLPLMQHALMRTWKNAVKRAEESKSPKVELELADYEEAGGVSESLHLHAQSALRQLQSSQDDPGIRVARHLFLLLCETSNEGQVSRRRPRVAEVMAVTGAPIEEVERVVRLFQDDDRNFILPLREEPFEQSTYLDVSHESLFRNWKTLKTWIQEERQSVEQYRELLSNANKQLKRPRFRQTEFDTVCAVEWYKQQRPTAYWASRYGGEGDYERAINFLEICRIDLEEEKRRVEAEIEKLAEEAKRNREASAALSGKLFKKATEKWASERRAARTVALDHGVRALRADRGNLAAKKAVCEWLGRHNWCVPLSPALRYEAANPVLVAVTPFENGLVAVAQDGNLLEWPKGLLGAGDSLMEQGGSDLFSIRQEGMEAMGAEDPSQPLAGERGRGNVSVTRVTYAAFSGNAKALVTFSSALNAPSKVQFWRWNEEGRRFDRAGDPLEVGPTGFPYRTFAWTMDGSCVVVTTMFLDRANELHPNVFRFDGQRYVPDDSLANRNICAATFSFDGKTLVTSAAPSEKGVRDCEIQFWDVRADGFKARDTSHRPSSFKVSLERPLSLSLDVSNRWLVVSAWGLDPVLVDLGQSVAEAKVVKLRHDEVLRTVFARAGANEKLLAVVTNDRVELVDPNILGRFARKSGDHQEEKYELLPVTEALPCQGNCVASFTEDGRRLATLSGSFFLSLDMVQLWGIRSDREPELNGSELVIPEGEAPEWLIRLASLLGDTTRTNAEDEIKGIEIHRIYGNPKYAEEPKDGVLAAIWERYSPRMRSSVQD